MVVKPKHSTGHRPKTVRTFGQAPIQSCSSHATGDHGIGIRIRDFISWMSGTVL